MTKKFVTLEELLKEHFTTLGTDHTCKKDGYVAYSLLGVRIHWRKWHQKDTGLIIIEPNKRREGRSGRESEQLSKGSPAANQK